VLIPPSTRTRSAGEAVEAFAVKMAALLDEVGSTLADHAVRRDEGYGWLREQRRIAHEISHVDRVLAETQESRRLNPRAAGSWNPVPDLRSGLDALEHSAVALRSVLRSIAEGAGAATVPDEADEAQQSGSERELRRTVADVLHHLAGCLRTYGTAVRAGAQTDATQSDLQTALDQLRTALDALHAARARLADLLLVGPREASATWQLHGSLLAGLDRVLEELDPDEFATGREQRRREAAERTRPTAQAAKRLRSSARRVASESPLVRRRLYPH
jgi:hypothetical protein